MTSDLDELWERWDRSGRRGRVRDELLVASKPFVRRIMRFMTIPSEHDAEQIVAEAQVAVYEAMEAFDPGRGVKFTTFAQHRVRGRIRDVMRSNDPMPRGARRRLTALAAAEETLTARLHRAPTDGELAAHLAVPEETVAATRQAELTFNVAYLSNVDDPGAGGPGGVDMAAHRSGFAADAGELGGPLDYGVLERRISEALSALQGEDRLVMVLYYVEKLTMSQIAELLDIRKSMVSKIRDRAMATALEALRR